MAPLLLNGHDLDVIPKDIMLLAAGDVGSPVSQTWWRLSPSDFEVRFTRDAAADYEAAPADIRFPDSVARTYTENGVQYTPVETQGFYGFDDVCSVATCPQTWLAASSFGQRDQLPTS
jgi:hypothetical protein